MPDAALAHWAPFPTLLEFRGSWSDTRFLLVEFLKASFFGERKQGCDFDVLSALLAPGPQLGAAIWGRQSLLPILPDPAAQPGTGAAALPRCLAIHFLAKKLHLGWVFLEVVIFSRAREKNNLSTLFLYKHNLYTPNPQYSIEFHTFSCEQTLLCNAMSYLPFEHLI